MFDIFKQIKEMEEVKDKIRGYCKTIVETYNKYAENKINTEGEFHSLNICRAPEQRICVMYKFLRDFGGYVLNDPNDEGSRRWKKDIRIEEETIYFPEIVFRGLTQPEKYSSEYIEEELRKFAEQENQKYMNRRFIESFKSFVLDASCGVHVDEQFHTMLMSFIADIRNCFADNKWFSEKYIETKRYSYYAVSTVRTVLKRYYNDNEQSLFSEILGNLKNKIPAALQLWDKSDNNPYYELDKMAEDIYNFNYCPHMNSKKYRLQANEAVVNLVDELYQSGYINSRTNLTDIKFKEYMLKYIALYNSASGMVLKSGILKDLIVDFNTNDTLSNLYAICEKILLLKADSIAHKEVVKNEDYIMIEELAAVAKDLIHIVCRLTTGMERKQMGFYGIDNVFGLNIFEELREGFEIYNM